MIFNKDNYIIKHPSELETMRVTSFKQFEQCPFTWMATYLAEVNPEKGIPVIVAQQKSVAASIGTAVHSIVELHLASLFDYKQDQYKDMNTDECWKIIKKSEQELLYTYLDVLSEYYEEGYKLLGLEQEIDIYIDCDGYELHIRGHIDALLESPSGGILIIDHKTNRGYNDVEWWKKQLQQLLYTYMVREMYPGKRISFCIGYPNLGTKVQWVTFPEDDILIREQIRDIYARMCKYHKEGFFPKLINEYCGFCALKDQCEEHYKVVNKFSESFLDKVEPKSLGEQLEFVKSVEKIVEAKRAEIEAKLKIEILNTPGNKVRQGNTIWYIETGSKRVLSAADLFDVINKETADNEELRNIVKSYIPTLVSVKVTGVDKLIKDTDAFGELKQRMVNQNNADVTLKSMPAGKLLKGK